MSRWVVAYNTNVLVVTSASMLYLQVLAWNSSDSTPQLSFFEYKHNINGARSIEMGLDSELWLGTSARSTGLEPS
ncbi:hypothetical protein BDV11DRAFT_178322 [Aspergillus similis]